MRKLLILLFLFITCTAFAAETAFADTLFARGEYYRAITEYYRLILADQDTAYCHAQICKSYLGGGDYEGLLDYLAHSQDPSDHLYKSLAYLKSDRADLAAIINDNPRREERALLFALSNSYMGRFEIAEQTLVQLDHPEQAALKEKLLEINRETAVLKYRKPLVAGALAIIPGLGYAYSGAWQTALSALVTNALLFGTVYELSQNELYFSSSALAVAGLGFYMGNIYGSVNHAAKRNQAIRKQNLDKYLDPLFIELWQVPQE